MNDTPRALGFRMPAEWEPHEATWLAWPHNRTDWPGKFAPVPWVYCEIVRHLARRERVNIFVPDRGTLVRARSMLRKTAALADSVEFIVCPTNRSWTRDYCPLFVKNAAGEVAATRWRFNGWAKYADWPKDDAAADAVVARLGVRAWRAGLVLEGGSIDVNGEGALLTTEECLLSPVQARNPGLSREDLERAFADYLGVTKVIWLKRGIAGDDTHGHIDDLARFTGPRTVAIASEEDPAEENYEPLKENLELLRRTPGFEIVTLPMPRPVWFDGQRLPASYLNFYIANGRVLVPTFNDPNDRIALDTLAGLFPGREVAGIHSVDLILGLGALHCATMQQPKGSS